MKIRIKLFIWYANRVQTDIDHRSSETDTQLQPASGPPYFSFYTIPLKILLKVISINRFCFKLFTLRFPEIQVKCSCKEWWVQACRACCLADYRGRAPKVAYLIEVGSPQCGRFGDFSSSFLRASSLGSINFVRSWWYTSLLLSVGQSKRKTIFYWHQFTISGKPIKIDNVKTAKR